MTGSLLQQVAVEVNRSAAILPVAEVQLGAARLRAAAALLARAAWLSGQPATPPRVDLAADHLDHATGALLSAQDALAGYLAAIAVGPTSVVPAPRTESAAGAVQQKALRAWWTRRVVALTQVQPSAIAATASDSVTLWPKVVQAARAGDRETLTGELINAGPAAGLGLGTRAALRLPDRLHRRLGRAPTAADLEPLRRLGSDRIRAVLPGAGPAVFEAILHRLCRPGRPRAAADPVGMAVASAILWAAIDGDDPMTPGPGPMEPADQRRTR